MIVLASALVAGLSLQQQVTVEILPGEVQIFSPVSGVYDSRMVALNITMSETALFRYAKYSDNGEELVTLCRDCTNYGFDKIKKKPFSEGLHNVSLVIEFEDGVVTSSVQFVVDSKKPRIKKTSPKNGFADGEFSVTFVEENVEELLLVYGNAAVGFRTEDVSVEDCVEGFWNNQECSVMVDLSDYDGSMIAYSFVLSDVAGNRDVSQAQILSVDFSKPVVSSFDFLVTGRTVHFSFAITEDNFESIYFIDRMSLIPHAKKLCTKLVDGKCEEKRVFTKGEHELDFEISDSAGNSVVINEVAFVV